MNMKETLPVSDVDIDKILEMAFEQYRSGNLHRARELYEEIVKIHPDNVTALHFIGLIYYEEGDYASAISYIKKRSGWAPAMPMLTIISASFIRISAISMMLKHVT